MKQTIPAATIGLLSQILPDYYTHDGLNGLFLRAFAPEEIPVGSKSSQVTTWLRSINAKCSDSSAVLGCLLGDFMDRESFFATCFGFGVDEESASKLREAQNKVSETLSKDGFCYSRVGMSQKAGQSQQYPCRRMFQSGPWAVDVEIRRALNNVESHPLAAVHNAGSVLEASFKAYLDHHKVEYREDTDTLSNLWQKVVEHIGISPKELDDKDLKKIASALFNIVEGTMHLRKKKRRN